MSQPNLRQWLLFIAWLVALASLLITLYASDVLAIPVCHLCWYQRICIYPLVLILGIATFRNDGNIAIYTIPLAAVGALFALYQYLQQMIPGFKPIDVCAIGPNCSDIHIKLLGFITYPFLSMLVCIFIIVLLGVAKRLQRYSLDKLQ